MNLERAKQIMDGQGVYNKITEIEQHPYIINPFGSVTGKEIEYIININNNTADLVFYEDDRCFRFHEFLPYRVQVEQNENRTSDEQEKDIDP